VQPVHIRRACDLMMLTAVWALAAFWGLPRMAAGLFWR
jgi:hypothetical protein